MVTRQASYGPIKRLIQRVTDFVVEKNSAMEVTLFKKQTISNGLPAVSMRLCRDRCFVVVSICLSPVGLLESKGCAPEDIAVSLR